jgi:hypothetical protein
MKRFRNSRPAQSAAYAAIFAATLAFGYAGGAAAQQSTPPGANAGTATMNGATDNATVGGSSSDNTSAGNTNGGGMPQVQQQGDVSFVSGGVGLDESKALQSAQHDWPLSLRFTGRAGEFLADVRVQITDSHGANVLDTTSRGPYMLVRVRPGRYNVHVSHAGVDKTSAVTVGSNGSARASFIW